MTKVTDINLKKINQETIDLLELLLEAAKRGELTSLFVVDNYSDGTVGHTWSGTTNMRMLGELRNLEFNFLSKLHTYLEDMDDL